MLAGLSLCPLSRDSVPPHFPCLTHLLCLTSCACRLSSTSPGDLYSEAFLQEWRLEPQALQGSILLPPAPPPLASPLGPKSPPPALPSEPMVPPPGRISRSSNQFSFFYLNPNSTDGLDSPSSAPYSSNGPSNAPPLSTISTFFMYMTLNLTAAQDSSINR